MRELIDQIFARHLANPLLNVQVDAATLPAMAGEIMVTTDGFTVQPLEFPGGTIGSLAVHGTVNDLAVSGAIPLYLTLNAFIEEGMEIAQLERIVASLAQAAREANVVVVAGDTKVLRRGEGGGLYLATTGVGVRPSALQLGMQQIQAGDAILLSGPVGDHGTAVLLAREQFGLRGDLQSDAASVLPITLELARCKGLRFMRDPTRGGLATTLNEIARQSAVGIELQESAIPVRPSVQAACELLGMDPLYVANEGKLVVIVEAAETDAALAAMRGTRYGGEACVIGRVLARPEGKVLIKTAIGGTRLVDMLAGEMLPRIC